MPLYFFCSMYYVLPLLRPRSYFVPGTCFIYTSTGIDLQAPPSITCGIRLLRSILACQSKVSLFLFWHINLTSDNLAQSVPTDWCAASNKCQTKQSVSTGTYSGVLRTTVTAVDLISDFASWSAATTTKLQQKKAAEKNQAVSRHATPSPPLPPPQANMSVDGSRQGTPHDKTSILSLKRPWRIKTTDHYIYTVDRQLVTDIIDHKIDLGCASYEVLLKRVSISGGGSKAGPSDRGAHDQLLLSGVTKGGFRPNWGLSEADSVR